MQNLFSYSSSSIPSSLNNYTSSNSTVDIHLNILHSTTYKILQFPQTLPLYHIHLLPTTNYKPPPRFYANLRANKHKYTNPNEYYSTILFQNSRGQIGSQKPRNSKTTRSSLHRLAAQCNGLLGCTQPRYYFCSPWRKEEGKGESLV